MAISLEDQIEFLQQISEFSDEPFPAALLNNRELIRDMWARIQNQDRLKHRFFDRLPPEVLFELFQEGRIFDEDLLETFSYPRFPIVKMLALLRKMDADTRYFLLDTLKRIDESRFERIESLIHVEYGMIAGIMIQNVNPEKEPVLLKESVRDAIQNPEFPIRTFYEYVYTWVRNPDGESQIEQLVEDTQSLLETEGSVLSKAHFAMALKFVILMTASPHLEARYQARLTAIQTQLMKGIDSFPRKEDVGMVLEQLPEPMLKRILQEIQEKSRVKDQNVRLKYHGFKTAIQTLCEKNQLPRVKRCIRRHQLEYTK